MPIADNVALLACVDTLNQLGRHRQVLAEYPEQRVACAAALEHLGQHREVATRYPELETAVAGALRTIGDYAELARVFPGTYAAHEAVIWSGRQEEFLDHPQRNIRALALLELGRFDEVLRDYPDQRNICARALEHQGRWAESLAAYGDVPWFGGTALAQLGRWEEAIATRQVDSTIARYGIAFRHYAAGEDALGAEALAIAEAVRFTWMHTADLHFARFVLAPTMRWRLGRGPSPIAAWRAWRSEHRERLGTIPERRFTVLLGESVTEYWGIDAPLLEAIRADVNGDAAQADVGYAKYRDRRPDMRSPLILEFIAARRR